MLIDTRKSPYAKASMLPQESVDWEDGFWKKRFDLCADVTIPDIFAHFEDPDPMFHVVENFRIAAGLHEGDHMGTPYGDGDLYKLMEAAIYVLAKRPDPTLEAKLDQYIALIASAQQADGYLSTKQIIADRQRSDGTSTRLGNINDFEVYNFGHLFTAACMHKRITGKDNFLKVAEKGAEYLWNLYTGYLKCGEAQTEVCPSHYMGIVELYRTTRNPRYLTLAEMAIAVRDLVKNGSDDNQDAKKLRTHRRITGHGVRATYLYAGVADLYAETGDEALHAVLESVWDNCVNQKLYITGGCGALYTGHSPYGSFPHHRKVDYVHQAFGYEYQLPNITAYNETCASLGNIMWNLRMFAIQPDAKYFDLIERTMLNLTLASVSLQGNRYFYENMLRRTRELDFDLAWPKSRAKVMRCFCCPPNMARFIAQSSEYAYMQSQDALWTGMYGASHARVSLENGARFTLRQETDYPWDGRISFSFSEVERDIPFTLQLRIPAWATSGSIQVNGEVIGTLSKRDAGHYYALPLSVLSGTTVVLTLEMPVRLTIAHSKVEEDLNEAAVECGPLVYCVESPDAPLQDLGRILLPVHASFRKCQYTIGGHDLVALETECMTFANSGWYDADALYQTLDPTPCTPVKIRMIPYFAWDNRGEGEMNIWLPLYWGTC